MDNLGHVSVPGIKRILGTTGTCVLASASHLLFTLLSRGAMGHVREGPSAGEQGGQLGTHDCPRDHGDSD